MSAKLRMDRRRFLAQLAMGAGAAAYSPCVDLVRLAKATGERRRRHLVNIVIWGGWDSSWFHNSLAVSDLADLGSLAAQYADDVSISSSAIGFEGSTFDKRFKLTFRHPDDQGAMHPSTVNPQFMGLGMGTVFSRYDLSRIAIWKGLKQEGQHGIGNEAMQMGMNSSYAISYTGIVADAIARNDYVRPLHYAALAAAPGSLYLNSAMNTGHQVPICIADPGQLARLTQSDPNDVADAGRRKAINDAISRLSGIAYSSAFRLKTSQGIASAFATSYQSALALTGSNLADDPEFLYCVKRIWMAMVDTGYALFNRPDLRTRQSAVGVDYATNLGSLQSSCSPLPSMSAYRLLKLRVAKDPSDTASRTQLEAERASLVASLRDIPGGGYSGTIHSLASSFGEAAFLVREDHSAVVDLAARAGGDPHGAYLNGVFELVCSMTGYRELVRLIAEKDTAEGASLLNSTLVVMHTELDREQWHQPGDPLGRPIHQGTNHADSTSLFMAGMGVKGGEIVGGIHRGPKDFGRFPSASGYDYLKPLPIDWTTGTVKPLSEGGRYCSTKAIFPTVLRIFGAAVPVQQITDYSALTAILKG
jgi:hypothetical protein